MNNEGIELKKVYYTYKSIREKDKNIEAVKGASFKIKQGEFVAIIGRNGSGKSTIAKLLNALILPTSGVVYVNNIDTKDGELLWEVRRSVGMVFQNPENQIVATTVEEDVAFGPENLGIPSQEIRRRVDYALEKVGLTKHSTHQPTMLSGGQKQRVAIAGILAMKPDCIVLDEATAMLDPVGCKEVLRVIKELNDKDKITIINITHHMDEACLFDRVIVIDDGNIKNDGKPEDIFSDVELIKNLGLDVPQIIELFYELNKCGLNLPLNIVKIDEAVEVLGKILVK
ncbi:MAG: energy-coupling factor transporter ATPase [Bacillota bacterium]|nr:energy-coupling factor transporter ATPase [Bacillota bacterium]